MNSSPRGRGTDKVQPSPELAHLTMQELRDYRTSLRQEEERVAYWQRLVHTRRDALTSGAGRIESLDRAALHRALGPTGTGDRRKTLLTAHSETPLPRLPALTGLWAADVNTSDAGRFKRAQKSLDDADASLTDYRAAVRDRLAAATSELITRYIDDPHRAFDLISPTPSS